MKKIHIIAIIMIVAGVAVLVSASGDMSTYGTFTEAEKNESKIKIAGTLAKDKPMHYNPVEDPNYFSFFMKDTEGKEMKVVLLQEKPQDFELSEQIVITGQIQPEGFIASDILLKCPSKYTDEEIIIKTKDS